MNDTFIKKGDIIVFDDKHKIICGDCTIEETYKFMNDEKATMCFTSPPYNVGGNNCESGKNAKYQTQKYNKIEEMYDKFGSQDIRNKSKKYFSNEDNKTQEDYLDFLLKSSNNALNYSKYLFFNIAHTSGNKIALIDYMYAMKEKYVDTIIWSKDLTLPAIEPNVLNSDYEYIYIYTNIKNNGKHIRIGEDFRGTKSNVINIKRNMQNKYANIHKALMPLDLCNKMILDFTKENDIVLDIFSGLGTNMISCMKNNRIYRGIELEPYYCQETINRYLEYKTDDINVKVIRNGKQIDFKDFKENVIKEYTLFTI